LGVTLIGRAASVPQFLSGISLGTALAIIGVLLTLLGIILALRSHAKARLVYQARHLTLIGQPDATSYGDIRILFNGAPVPRLMVTRLAFWNAGNTTVRRADLVDRDPLTVSFEEEATILGSRTLSETRAVNEFRLSLNRDRPSRAFLTFDYLDRNDGAVFEIIHTGSKGKANVTGSVRGIPKGAENWGDLSDWERQKSSLSEIRTAFVIPAAFLVLLLLLKWLQNILAKNHPALASAIGSAPLYFLTLVGALFCLAILFAFGYTVLSYWHSLPKSLSRKS
jgi:hypothetical protein